jgi:hypothetical protein
VSSPIWGPWPDINYCLTVTVLFCGVPSLTRGRVCLLYMLLTLVSVVFLGSESLGTRDHILLSVLRLPFSSPPTTRRVTVEVFDPASTRGVPTDRPRFGYVASGRINGKHLSFPQTRSRLFFTERRVGFQESISMETCLLLCDVLASKNLSPWKRVLPTRSLAMGLHITILVYHECYIVSSMFNYSQTM